MLPLLGQTAGRETEIVQHLQGLAQESCDARAEWDDVVLQSMRIFVHGDIHQPAEGQVVIPKIQDAVIATTLTQTQTPPSASIEPVETGEPPEYYWNGPTEEGYALSLPPEYVEGYLLDPIDPSSIQDPLPIPTRLAERLMATALTPERAPVLPPGFIRPDWICGVDDRLCADVAQTVFDVLWMRSDIDRFFRTATLNVNIQGTLFAAYEFDDIQKKHLTRLLPFTQVHIDPSAKTIREANYAGYDLPLDADEAKTLYPHLADFITRAAVENTHPPVVDQNTTWSSQVNRTWRRPVVTLRIFWIRNQPCPMTPDHAVQSGSVIPTEVSDAISAGPEQEQAQPTIQDATTASGVDEDDGSHVSAGSEAVGLSGGFGEGTSGGPIAESFGTTPPATDVQGGDLHDGYDQGEVDDAIHGQGKDGGIASVLGVSPAGWDSDNGSAGSATAAPTSAPIPTRIALLHPETSEELTPDHPEWPTYNCIRQITQLVGDGEQATIVDDKPSEFYDFPIFHAVNIPMPGSSPWGLGEPMRLRCMQLALSQNVDNAVQQGDLLAHPISTMSRSMYIELGSSVEKARAQAGQVIVVDDVLYDRLQGKIETVHESPPLSPATQQLITMLDGMIDESSGNTPTMRGSAPSANASGKMVELLQTSGSAMMEFKAQSLGDMVYAAAQEFLHSQITRMSLEDITRIVSKYRDHVIRVVRTRWKQSEWNIIPKVAIGGMNQKMQKLQLVEALMPLGLIDPQTACEMLNLDYRVIRERQVAHQLWAANQMGATGMQQGQAGQQQEQANGQRQPAA